MRVAINGLGRIGRAVFKLLVATPELEVAAVNDVTPADNLAYLLNHDTVYGRYANRVTVRTNSLVVADQSYPVYAEPDPSRSGNTLYIDDSALAVEAAAAGHGIALARGRLVADELRSGRLVRLFEREVPAEYSYWAVWNPSSSKLPVVLPFVEAVAALFMDEEGSTDI